MTKFAKQLISNISDAAYVWWDDSWEALEDSANNWSAVCKSVEAYNKAICSIENWKQVGIQR